MIEKYFKTQEDVELIELWMKTPPHKRPEAMPAEMAEHLERLQLANSWLLAHGSKKKVWPMLLAHYKALGKPYSESTARRDVNDAQRLFSTLSKHTSRWVTELMIDNLLERMDSCARAGKDREYAMLSVSLDRWLERADKYMQQDEDAIHNPVPILAVFDPEEAGIKPDPNIREKIAAWIERRKRMEGPPGSVTDAEFTETE